MFNSKTVFFFAIRPEVYNLIMFDNNISAYQPCAQFNHNSRSGSVVIVTGLITVFPPGPVTFTITSYVWLGSKSSIVTLEFEMSQI